MDRETLTEQQQRIIRDAQRLLETLKEVIPSSTIHYAVTDLQRGHLPALIRVAGTIRTKDVKP